MAAAVSTTAAAAAAAAKRPRGDVSLKVPRDENLAPAIKLLVRASPDFDGEDVKPAFLVALNDLARMMAKRWVLLASNATAVNAHSRVRETDVRVAVQQDTQCGKGELAKVLREAIVRALATFVRTTGDMKARKQQGKAAAATHVVRMGEKTGLTLPVSRVLAIARAEGAGARGRAGSKRGAKGTGVTQLGAIALTAAVEQLVIELIDASRAHMKKRKAKTFTQEDLLMATVDSEGDAELKHVLNKDGPLLWPAFGPVLPYMLQSMDVGSGGGIKRKRDEPAEEQEEEAVAEEEEEAPPPKKKKAKKEPKKAAAADNGDD